MPTKLDAQLSAALESREERLIRRRLPDPQADEGLADFSSNDYLSLASSPLLRARFLDKLTAAPHVLGSGGSRLLVNGPAHAALETRLARFFRAPTALLFNSGFDANVGFFSAVPQPGDALVFDEHIHASVHDGMRASRVQPDMRRPFAHNSVDALRYALERLIEEYPDMLTGGRSAFLTVETLYSMDGTVCPLVEMVEVMEELLPCGNGYVVVDEAHATGIYGPQGRGLVALLGLEDRVLARLHTFGKALAGTGGTCTFFSLYFMSLRFSSYSTHNHSDPGLPPQLRTIAHLHDLPQLREHHLRRLLLRPPRRRHGRAARKPTGRQQRALPLPSPPAPIANSAIHPRTPSKSRAPTELVCACAPYAPRADHPRPHAISASALRPPACARAERTPDHMADRPEGS